MPDADDPDTWFCPALSREIEHGLCWECCFAETGGPTDTTAWLRRWCERSARLASLAEFHEVCARCPHCRWWTPTPSATGVDAEGWSGDHSGGRGRS